MYTPPQEAKAVKGDVLVKLLATYAGDGLRDLRDRAILMVAFASGGRRRSEVAGLRVDQLTVELPIEMPDGPPLPSLAIHLGRMKTTSGWQDDTVYLTGRPVEALYAWMSAAKIDKGSVIRGIGRWGTVSKRAIDPQSVNVILKQRAEMAGLESGEFSAHGLRSGYLTDCQPLDPLPRGDRAVASSVCAAGFELLQQCNAKKRSSGKNAVNCFIATLVCKRNSRSASCDKSRHLIP